MDEGDGVEFPGRELGVDRLVIDRFAPGHLERLGFLAAAPRNVEPFVGKGAAHAAEHALPNEIADRRLHHAPGRGSGKKDGLLRSEQFLEPGMDLAVERFEGVAAVADHRTRKRGHGFLRDLDRARSEKLVVWNHEGTSNVHAGTSNAELGAKYRMVVPRDCTVSNTPRGTNPRSG